MIVYRGSDVKYSWESLEPDRKQLVHFIDFNFKFILIFYMITLKKTVNTINNF